jgi:hypothetical protein
MKKSNDCMKELTDKDIEPLLGAERSLIGRFTNRHSIRFYLIRQKEIKIITRPYCPEFYINFYGFFKYFDEFNPRQVMMTFGVTESYDKAFNLSEKELLQPFLFQYGIIEFRKFLNSVEEYKLYDETMILNIGNDSIIPIFKNGRLVFPSLHDDDERLIQKAEKTICRIVLENKGQHLLHCFDFRDECFVPREILHFVNKKLFTDKYVQDKNYGILTEEGESAFHRIVNSTPLKTLVKENIIEAIRAGENNQTEFKSSLRWDLRSNKVNSDLEFVIIKSICAFSNADGGNLIIGIADDGHSLGLLQDYKSFENGHGDKDLFERHIYQLLISSLGHRIAKSVAKISFILIDEIELCIVNVPAGKEPIFLKKENAEKFFIRMGNSTRELTTNTEITKYCIQRFGNVV